MASPDPEHLPEPPASPGPANAAPRPADAAPTTPAVRRVLVAVFLLALVFGGWGLWRVFAPASTDLRAQLAASEHRGEQLAGELAELQQQVATLGRSDQISRDANRDLQRTLAERDEEVAGLRADVAFYERLVGSTSQRRGLTVHALKMTPQSGSAWHFQGTLTQNLNRGAVSSGRLRLSIEGSRGGRLEALGWDTLRQQPQAEGVEYSFKYFQQVRGDVFLPPDFEPVRVTVRLVPRSGAAVEQSFTWADVAAGASSPAPAAE